MKKKDWIEYFEAIHSRSPEQHEIANALITGEIESESESVNQPSQTTSRTDDVNPYQQAFKKNDDKTTCSEHKDFQEIHRNSYFYSPQAEQTFYDSCQSSSNNSQNYSRYSDFHSSQFFQQTNNQFYAGQPSNMSLFLKQFKVWLFSAWRFPTSVNRMHKYNGITSIVVVSFLAALAPFLLVNSLSSKVTSMFNNFFDASFSAGGIIGSSFPSIQFALGIDILFKLFITVLLFILSIIFSGFIVKKYVYKEEVTLDAVIEYYGRLYAINILLLAITSISAILGIYIIWVLLMYLTISSFLLSSIFALANFKNNNQIDPLYKYFIATLVNGIVISFFFWIVLSIMGQMIFESLI